MRFFLIISVYESLFSCVWIQVKHDALFNSEIHILKPVRNIVQCSTKIISFRSLNVTFFIICMNKGCYLIRMTSKFVTPPVFLTNTLPLKGRVSQLSSAITTFFLLVINCLLFFNSFVCFEFAEKRAWSITHVGCYVIYNTLK